jgi:hypothetical protein
MKRAIFFAALIVTAVAPPATRAQNPTTIFIQNATVLTVTHGNIEHGSILIRDGKIGAVGADLKAPEGATIIDATGAAVAERVPPYLVAERARRLRRLATALVPGARPGLLEHDDVGVQRGDGREIVVGPAPSVHPAVHVVVGDAEHDPCRR